MITFKQSGSFKNTEGFFRRAINSDHRRLLEKYGQKGVDALKEATPKDTGKTADSWQYDIVNEKNYLALSWSNSNIVDGVPIALVLQYGHATVDGMYVQGIDYINPAMQPIFESLIREIWEEVTKS